MEEWKYNIGSDIAYIQHCDILNMKWVTFLHCGPMYANHLHQSDKQVYGMKHELVLMVLHQNYLSSMLSLFFLMFLIFHYTYVPFQVHFFLKNYM